MNVGTVFQLSQEVMVDNGKNNQKTSGSGFEFMLGNALGQAQAGRKLEGDTKAPIKLSVEELTALLASLTEDQEIPSDIGVDIESFLLSMDMSVEEIMNVMESLMKNLTSTSLPTLYEEASNANTPEEWVNATAKFLEVLVSEGKDKENQLPIQTKLNEMVQVVSILKKFIRQSDQTSTTDRISQSLNSTVDDLKSIVQQLLNQIQRKENDATSKFQQALLRLPNQSTNETSKITSLSQGLNVEQSIISSNASSTFEQVALHLPKGTTKLQTEAFVREFTNVLSKANWMKNPMQSKLQINLYPEHLGTLKIELVQKDGILTARILASSLAAKEMIDTNLSSLKNSFALQNIQVEKVEVFQSSAPDLRQSSRDSYQGGQQQEQQSDQQEDKSTTRTFLDELSEQLQSAEEDVTS
ncbi:flagellar hook-length control protein FliK [Mangrovibacillus cuniculi]|uniref:Flagellar hook-length control protein-like C-terminal domain-containing protein n=1 Tax=Mangrovibacillus cuniculi TaxID=2593652 RepID=A0A7S8CAG8_9BACI|nr:flagellar hook-length control protein FliK [Mangrovibacillus cuniculi]QPC46347.1 hypothetical protein G8O30_04895 [Mangrovibacillus cuniculi]